MVVLWTGAEYAFWQAGVNRSHPSPKGEIRNRDAEESDSEP